LLKADSYNPSTGIITYTFTVFNTGDVTVSGIVIDDERIGVTNLAVSPSTLEPGQSGIAIATYQVSEEDIMAGGVSNTALVTGIDENGKVVEDTSGTDIENNDPTVTVIVSEPSLLVEKEAFYFGSKAQLGELVEFRIRVTNTGNVTLTNVVVRDPLTGFMQVVGVLSPGGSVVYTTEYTVTVSDELAGEFVNIATATGTSPGGIPVESSGSVTVPVDRCEVIIPNGFSPNGDGIQDFWRITCLEKYPNARIEVYNRWGNLVYEKNNYGNLDVHGPTDAWWDGYSTHKWTIGTDKLPTGTYFYILDLKDGSKPLNGFIFLNR
jgi:gliding motility-associated-like protein/uncharacterized repeat protein (TIGR01451 family)